MRVLQLGSSLLLFPLGTHASDSKAMLESSSLNRPSLGGTNEEENAHPAFSGPRVP